MNCILNRNIKCLNNNQFSKQNWFLIFVVLTITSHISEKFFIVLNFKLFLAEIFYCVTFFLIPICQPKFNIENHHRLYLCLLFGFFLCLTISDFLTKGQLLFQFKILQTYSSALLIPLAIFLDEKTLKKLFQYLLIYILIATAAYFVLFFTYQFSVAPFSNIDWLELQSIPSPLSELLLFTSIFLIFEKTGKQHLHLVLTVSFILLVALGSRGSLFLFLCSVFIFFVKLYLFEAKGAWRIFQFSKFEVIVVLFFITCILSLNFMDPDRYFLDVNLMRHLTVFSDSDSSMNGRFQVWSQVIHGIPQNLFLGHGVNSTFEALGGTGGLKHPHNVFLELFYEGGLLALAPFCLLMGYSFLFQRSNLTSVLIFFSAMLLISKSSSYSELRVVHFFIICSMMLAAFNRHSTD